MKIPNLILGFLGGRSITKLSMYFVCFPLVYPQHAMFLLSSLRHLLNKGGLWAIVYTDDGICASNSISDAEKARDTIVSDLTGQALF